MPSVGPCFCDGCPFAPDPGDPRGTAASKDRHRRKEILPHAGFKLKVGGILLPIGFYLTWHAECLSDRGKGILMVKLKVNGIDRAFDGDPNMPLLWYLRDVLGLTGTKFGCGIALCGACTVHKNGEAIRACITPMNAAANSEIRTIEDLGANGLNPVQAAWMEVNVPQCGYCQSGQIMQAVSLLKSTPHPTDQQIDDAMAGNICRCGTYQRIRQAINLAAGKIA
jgi:isoquinoline 1-oxidoreductase alpha subunit